MAPHQNDAQTLRSAILTAVESGTPFSFVRLGDGEGALLNVSNRSTLRDLSYFETHFGPNTSLENVVAARDLLVQAIGSADIVGVRQDVLRAGDECGNLDPKAGDFLDRFKTVFPLRPSEKDVINLHSAQRVHRLYEFYRAELQQSNCISQWSHFDLQIEGFWDTLFGSLEDLCFIGANSQLKPKLENRFDLTCHHLPVNGKYSEAKPAQSQLEVDVERVANHITTDEKGRVYLVAAGLVGKRYCHQIKENGGIAIDIGALADFWTGKSNRGLINQEYGGAECNQYHAPSSLMLRSLPRVSSNAIASSGKKVLLHVGTSKTGSTSLQNNILHNEDRLRKLGFSYVKAGRRDSDKLNHHPVAMAFGLGREDIEESEERSTLVPQIQEEILAGNAEQYLISSEMMSNTFPVSAVEDDFVRFVHSLDAKVVIYVRNQLDWIISWYNHMVRMGQAGGSIEAFFPSFKKTAQQFSYNFLAKIKFFEAIVGKENILLVAYDDAKTDLYRDFYQRVGLGHALNELEFETQKKAAAASDHAMYLILALSRKMNRASPKFQQVLRELTPAVQGIELGPSYTKAFVNRLFNVSRPVNDAIRQDYGVNLEAHFRRAIEKRTFSEKSQFEGNLQRIMQAI